MWDVVSEFLEIFLIEFYFKVNSIFGVVFPETNNFRISLIHDFVEIFFIVLSPFAYWKLFDMDYPISILIKLNYALNLIFSSLQKCYFTCEAFIPGLKLGKFLLVL